ncbi:MAG: hydrogenase expression/formation protein [Planctomycetes bacterium]|nr:hydrogenase expression/formation protein [Planctomycetota bacterium]
MKRLPLGKLDPRLLTKLLEKYTGATNSQLVIGPSVGEDAAVIRLRRMGDRYLVAKSDPITYATERIGWYAVHINANDRATLGAEPKWFLATLLLPEGKTDKGLVRGIFADMARAAKDLGVALSGGHTEVTPGLDRPILIGHMLGEVARDRLVLKTNARPGDRIILTKGIAIEGTALLAREKSRELVTHFGKAFVQRAKRFLIDPGISVVKEALTAAKAVRVHAMHDLTEGGLATGIREMAEIAGLGAEVDRQRIPVFPETQELCSYYGLDPLGTIASGSLLIAVAKRDRNKVLSALRAEGIQAEDIGCLVEKARGLKLMEDGRLKDFPTFEVDEVTRILSRD